MMFLPELPLEPREPITVTTCIHCGEDIRVGDDYYHIDGWDYCENCGEVKLGEFKRVAEPKEREYED